MERNSRSNVQTRQRRTAAVAGAVFGTSKLKNDDAEKAAKQ